MEESKETSGMASAARKDALKDDKRLKVKVFEGDKNSFDLFMAFHEDIDLTNQAEYESKVNQRKLIVTEIHTENSQLFFVEQNSFEGKPDFIFVSLLVTRKPIKTQNGKVALFHLDRGLFAIPLLKKAFEALLG